MKGSNRREEEGPWAGTGLELDGDDDEKKPEAGSQEGSHRGQQEQEVPLPSIFEDATAECKEHRAGWGLAQNCSEPRPQQTTLRVGAAFLTCLAETVPANDRVRPGDGGDGHCRELDEWRKRRCFERTGVRSPYKQAWHTWHVKGNWRRSQH